MARKGGDLDALLAACRECEEQIDNRAPPREWQVLLICGSEADARQFGFSSQVDVIKFLAAFASEEESGARYMRTNPLEKDFGGAKGSPVHSYHFSIGRHSVYVAFFFHPVLKAWKIKSFKENDDEVVKPLRHNPFSVLGKKDDNDV